MGGSEARERHDVINFLKDHPGCWEEGGLHRSKRMRAETTGLRAVAGERRERADLRKLSE